MDINGIIRHPREGGDPVINKPIDSRLRGNDVHGVIEHLLLISAVLSRAQVILHLYEVPD